MFATRNRWAQLLVFLSPIIAAGLGWMVVNAPLNILNPALWVLGVLLIFVIVNVPELGVGLLIGTEWLDRLFPSSGVLTVNRALGVIILFSVLARNLRRSDARAFVLQRFDIYCLGYIVAILASLAANYVGELSEPRLMDMVTNYLTYWLIVNTISDGKKLKLVLFFIILASLALSVFAIQDATTNSNEIRFGREVQQINVVGDLAFIGVMVALWLANGIENQGSKFYYIFVPIYSVTMFLSGNRSTIPITIISAATFFLFQRSSNKKYKILLVSFALVLAGALLVDSISPETLDRVLSVGSSAFSNNPDPQEFRRVYLSRASWKMFQEHPVFGVGFGNFRDHAYRYEPILSGSITVEHNLFTGTLAETGVVGVSFLALMYVEVFRNLWKTRQQSHSGSDQTPYLMALFVGANIVSAAFNGAVFGRYRFIIFALVMIVSRLATVSENTNGLRVNQPPLHKNMPPHNG